MALWGKRDSYAITGTANAVLGSATVTGNATATFTTQIDAGDSLFINSTHVKVATVNAANNLTLATSWAAANASNQTITGQDSPKYVPYTDIANIYGIDQAEAAVAANKAKGLNTPGWNRYVTYTDVHGKTRHKVENLVAFSSMTGDASDDSVAADS
jgi:hypothetical protein